MAYNEGTAKRVRNILSNYNGITEKKMFGGLCFMMDGNMLCGVGGITKDGMLFRLDPLESELLLKEKGVKVMEMRGKKMKGFLYVRDEVLKDDKDLEKWINKSIEFVKTLPKKK